MERSRPISVAFTAGTASSSAEVKSSSVMPYFSFSSFITASFTNAVFDKYINSRIEGAQVNRGLSQEDNDDDDDDDEQEEERELKPWENGYTDKH